MSLDYAISTYYLSLPRYLNDLTVLKYSIADRFGFKNIRQMYVNKIVWNVGSEFFDRFLSDTINVILILI